MTRSKPFLRNSARRALSASLILYLISGCSSSTEPTYLKKDIEEVIPRLCKTEYQLDVKAKLVGSTLWLYLPVEDIFEKADKPEKYLERFAVEYNKDKFKEGSLQLEYLIRSVPEKEKYQEYKYNKDVLKKINGVWQVLRRVIFSMERSETPEPVFFYIVIADIKNGVEIKETLYYLDIKKVSYGFISMDEYQHRAIQESSISPAIFGDKEGKHLRYYEVTLQDFIVSQIGYRVRLKFQKPEVERGADIDKEIIKIAVHTIKTYEFRDFARLELSNLFTQNKIALSQASVWATPLD